MKKQSDLRWYQFGLGTLVGRVVLGVAIASSATAVAIKYWPNNQPKTVARPIGESRYFDRVDYDATIRDNGGIMASHKLGFFIEDLDERDPETRKYDLTRLKGMEAAVSAGKVKAVDEFYQDEKTGEIGSPYTMYRLCKDKIDSKELKCNERIPTLKELREIFYRN